MERGFPQEWSQNSTERWLVASVASALRLQQKRGRMEGRGHLLNDLATFDQATWVSRPSSRRPDPTPPRRRNRCLWVTPRLCVSQIAAQDVGRTGRPRSGTSPPPFREALMGPKRSGETTRGDLVEDDGRPSCTLATALQRQWLDGGCQEDVFSAYFTTASGAEALGIGCVSMLRRRQV